jgi:hypothetical protein
MEKKKLSTAKKVILKVQIILALVSTLVSLLFALVFKSEYSYRFELGFGSLGALFLISIYICNSIFGRK